MSITIDGSANTITSSAASIDITKPIAVTGAVSSTAGSTFAGGNTLGAVAGSIVFDYSAGYGKLFVRGPDATTLPGLAFYLTESDGGGLITPLAFNNAGLATIGYGLVVTGTVKTSGYTVATLPAGATGDRAYVTDATAPTYLGALTGGGAVVCPVFKNASAWVSS